MLLKEIENATGIEASDLATEKDFIALKVEVDKLDIVILVNVLARFNNLKTKVADLDIGKLQTVPIDLKKISDVVDNQVVKNKTLKAKGKK